MPTRRPMPVTTRRVPDARQPRWSTSHAATVLKYRVGVTINCDCGTSYHGATQDEAEARWERHVKASRV
jgi:hypothetical protein